MRCLGKDGTLIEMAWVQSLDSDTGVLTSFDYGMFDRGWAMEVWKERRMHIQAAVLRMAENARRHEEAKGDGNHKVDGNGRCPACKGVDCMGGQVELVGGYLLDGHCGVLIDGCMCWSTV